MLTLLINLDRSTDRLLHMQNLLNELGVEFERIAAIDGKALSNDILKTHQDTKQINSLTASEIGCFLSHRKAWQKLVSSSHSFALVLEDDISASNDLRLFLNDESWIPSNADIIKVEAFLNKKIKLGKRPFSLHNNRALYRLMSGHMGGAAYIISRQKAEALLIETANFNTPVDRILFDDKYLTNSIIYQMIPALVRQHSTSSNAQSGIFASTLERDEIDQSHKKNTVFLRFKKEILRSYEKIKVFITKHTGIGAYIVKTVTFK